VVTDEMKGYRPLKSKGMPYGGIKFESI
jgi:hypothetical protein